MSRLSNNRKKALTERDWDTVIKYGEMELNQEPQSIKILNDLAFAYFNKKIITRRLSAAIRFKR